MIHKKCACMLYCCFTCLVIFILAAAALAYQVNYKVVSESITSCCADCRVQCTCTHINGGLSLLFIFNLFSICYTLIKMKLFFLKYMFAGLEARKTKPGPGTRRAQARTGHTKTGFCPGPGFNFWHPVRSRVAPNPDRTRGFAKPIFQVPGIP